MRRPRSCIQPDQSVRSSSTIVAYVARSPASIPCYSPRELRLRGNAEYVTRAEPGQRALDLGEHARAIRGRQRRHERREGPARLREHRPELGRIARELRELHALLANIGEASGGDRRRERAVGGEVEESGRRWLRM